ncbi:MAG: ABC transporter ATP-binding protein [Pseudobdellovibrio sp.]
MLKLTNISKSYSNDESANYVIKNLNLEIKKGEFFSLLGPSGCGKTTLMRLIAGLENLSEGSIELNSQPIHQLGPQKRPFHMVFQKYALFPHLSIFENVAFGLRLKKKSESEIKTLVLEMLELVSLAGFESRFPETLSGGQQQRVALARALVNKPEILLLDEPLSALDLKLRSKMQTELKLLQKKTGITFIFVTHDQGEALALSDRIAVMQGGRIEQLGTPEELYNSPRTLFVADFIGESSFINEPDGKVRMLRPESLRPANENGPGSLSYSVEVFQSSFRGTDSEVFTQLSDGQVLKFLAPAGKHYSAGQKITLSANPELCPVFEKTTL